MNFQEIFITDNSHNASNFLHEYVQKEGNNEKSVELQKEIRAALEEVMVLGKNVF